MVKPIYHVIKVSTSGLGDAIKSVLAGALYAEKTNRTLIVDWRKSLYSDSDENSFFELFTLRNINYELNIPQSATVVPASWRGNLNFSFHELYTCDNWQSWDRTSAIETYSVDFSKFDYDESITVSWDFDQIVKLLPHFEGLSTANDLFRYAANRYLVIASKIKDPVDRIVKSLPADFGAIHIRHTEEFDKNKGNLELTKYYRALNAMLPSPQRPYFLACDNQHVQELLLERFPNAVTIDKWFAEPGAALHLDRNCPNRLQNAVDALTDMLVLSRAKTFICNFQSSFAQSASLFASQGDQNIIDLNKLNKKNTRYHTYLLSWLKRFRY